MPSRQVCLKHRIVQLKIDHVLLSFDCVFETCGLVLELLLFEKLGLLQEKPGFVGLCDSELRAELSHLKKSLGWSSWVAMQQMR